MGGGASATQDSLKHDLLDLDQRRGGLGSADRLVNKLFPRAWQEQLSRKIFVEVRFMKRRYRSSEDDE
jgi:hypothetical protein